MTLQASKPASRSEPAEVDDGSIEKVGAYLKHWLEKSAPDAVLTQAWEGFFRVYSTILARMAAAFQLDEHEREDLVQEVWLQVIRNFAEYQWERQGAGLRSYLYVTVRNRALNILRHKRRHPVQTGEQARIEAWADPSGEPASQWDMRWDREVIHLVLADLEAEVGPSNHRLLTMRLLEGRSLPDAATSLGLTKAQVKDRQKRLFRKLRAAVAYYRGQPPGTMAELPPSLCP